MNRQIKFRAWDKKNKKMLTVAAFYPNTQQIEDNNKNKFDKQEYTLQQFTGLLDKNGKEIYEGDVLSVVSNKTDSKERIVEMKFEEHNTGDFTNFSIWGFRDYSKSTYGATVEIVGNIRDFTFYKNPDLIK